MNSTPLYQQIAEAVRQAILYGELRPGDRAPTVRAMAAQWQCTPGTVQRAYRELREQGLISSQAGQGTRIAATLPDASPAAVSLRRAGLVNRAEGFLLEMLAAGHSAPAVEQALRVALERWRVAAAMPVEVGQGVLRFAGSHDPAVAWLAGHFEQVAAGFTLQLRFSGSLGGLMALAQGEADLAGCHLWDEESDSTNVPFVRRLLPGRKVALLTLAHRRLGLMLPAGNPAGVRELVDLSRAGLRFVNRQRGAGTRVWLDVQLRRCGLDPAAIAGYDEAVATHSAAAAAVAEGRADVALGVETAALDAELAFVPLARERYDLAMLAETWQMPAVQGLAGWLASEVGRAVLDGLGGYETGASGQVVWVGTDG